MNQVALVFGLGISGKSMVGFLANQSYKVIIYDDRYPHSTYDNQYAVYNSLEELSFETLDLIAFSPGISPEHPLFVKAEEYSIKLISELELGLQATHHRCIAITGTNGKSTLTALCAHILKEQGLKARAVGNIGVPLTSEISNIDEDEILVVEVSSYQIDALDQPYFKSGIVLNITPDHLDRYKTMSNYARSKLNLQKLIKPEGQFFCHSKVVQDWPQHVHDLTSLRLFDQEFIENVQLQNRSLSLENTYEIENFAAVYALLSPFIPSLKKLFQSYLTFQGLAHRCEHVMRLKGVNYINDSKATNVESVIKAIASMKTNTHMIMGGDDKGLDYSPLRQAFRDKVKNIFLIGDAKEKMAKVFEKEYNTVLCLDLKHATLLAAHYSQSGDTVLLSPGTSSFKMFKNFEERGNQFKSHISEMEGENYES